jgi:hypothetical protein
MPRAKAEVTIWSSECQDAQSQQQQPVFWPPFLQFCGSLIIHIPLVLSLRLTSSQGLRYEAPFRFLNSVGAKLPDYVGAHDPCILSLGCRVQGLAPMCSWLLISDPELTDL